MLRLLPILLLVLPRFLFSQDSSRADWRAWFAATDSTERCRKGPLLMQFLGPDGEVTVHRTPSGGRCSAGPGPGAPTAWFLDSALYCPDSNPATWTHAPPSFPKIDDSLVASIELFADAGHLAAVHCALRPRSVVVERTLHPQSSAEAEYLRARRDSVRSINAPGRPLGSSLGAADDAAIAELARRLRPIIGPLGVPGWDSGRINLESLFEEVGYGDLDGIRYMSADKQTEMVVTTRAIMSGWLADDSARKTLSIESSLHSERVLADALGGDAMVLRYADLPIADLRGKGVVSAMLMIRAQDYGEWPPNMLLVTAVRGNRIFIMQSGAAARIAAPPACTANLHAAFKTMEERRARHEPEMNGDSVFAVYRSCYGKHLSEIPGISAIAEQVSKLVAALPPR